MSTVVESNKILSVLRNIRLKNRGSLSSHEEKSDDSNLNNEHLEASLYNELTRRKGARKLNFSNCSDEKLDHSLYNELTRSQGVRNLSLLTEIEEENDVSKSEKNTLIEFVQRVNRTISKHNNSECSSEEDDIISEYGTSDSLAFFYNYDSEDNNNIITNEITSNQFNESLPDSFFDDGNFELVDGLIVLIDKKPGQKKLDFKSNALSNRRIQHTTMRETSSRAA